MEFLPQPAEFNLPTILGSGFANVQKIRHLNRLNEVFYSKWSIILLPEILLTFSEAGNSK